MKASIAAVEEVAYQMNKFLISTIFVITLVVGLIMLNSTNPTSSTTLKLGLFELLKVKNLDPKRVNTLTEATILRSLYNSLFEYDLNGQIITSIAENFKFEKDGTLSIQIRSDKFLSDGSSLTGEDIVLTLKRLMLDGKNTHGDFKNLICPDYTLKSVFDDCPGLSFEGQIVKIKPVSDDYQKYIMELLASVDYRIIPKKALNLDDPLAPIARYDITTGPYYFKNEQTDTEFVLHANPRHYLYNPKMPLTVQAVATNGNTMTDQFIKSEIDIIPTVSQITQTNLDKIEKSGIQFDIEKTFKLSVKIYFFSPKAMKELSADNRFRVAKLLA